MHYPFVRRLRHRHFPLARRLRHRRPPALPRRFPLVPTALLLRPQPAPPAKRKEPAQRWQRAVRTRCAPARSKQRGPLFRELTREPAQVPRGTHFDFARAALLRPSSTALPSGSVPVVCGGAAPVRARLQRLHVALLLRLDDHGRRKQQRSARQVHPTPTRRVSASGRGSDSALCVNACPTECLSFSPNHLRVLRRVAGLLKINLT